MMDISIMTLVCLLSFITVSTSDFTGQCMSGHTWVAPRLVDCIVLVHQLSQQHGSDTMVDADARDRRIATTAPYSLFSELRNGQWRVFHSKYCIKQDWLIQVYRPMHTRNSMELLREPPRRKGSRGAWPMGGGPCAVGWHCSSSNWG